MARLRVAVLVAAMAAVQVPAAAQNIPWKRLHLDLRANNEPLNVFLGRVLAFSGIPASMSAPVASARVNGRLEGTAESIFRELVDTYGLTWYHDGSMLYIYSLAETESKMLQVNPADVARIERGLREMHLLDPRFPLRVATSEGQLLVTGPPQYVQLVADVVGGVSRTPSQNPRQVDVRVFRLRHARAADTVVSIGGTETTIPGVARILNETLGSSRLEAAPAARALPTALSGLRGRGQIAIGRPGPLTGTSSGEAAGPASTNPVAAEATTNEPPSSSAVAGGSFPGGETTATGSRPATPSIAPGAPFPMPTPSQRLISDGVVRADPRINAVVVRDTQDRMPMYERLVNELDLAMPLLEIEATVIDVSRDKSEALGIDWRLHGQRADIVSSPNGLAGASGTTNDANNLQFSLPARSSGGAGLVGTLLFGSERTNFLARVNALTANGDASLVSKPRVLTLNNTEAVLQSTQDFYVRVAGRDQVDLFNVSLGLVLRVTPTLIEAPEGAQVKLNIRVEDGNTDTGSQVDQIPVVNRNAISTQALVADGHSLLIGGYTIDQKTRNTSGVPVLSDIPGLRWLFGQKSTGTKRVERMFMITPRLVRPEEIAGDTSAAASGFPMSTATLKGEGGDRP